MTKSERFRYPSTYVLNADGPSDTVRKGLIYVKDGVSKAKVEGSLVKIISIRRFIVYRTMLFLILNQTRSMR